MKKWILLLLIWTGLLIGCEDSPSVSRGDDQAATDDGANNPPDAPANTPSNWTQIRLTMAKDQDTSACGFEDFKIIDSGAWSFTQCQQAESGQLTASESETLNQRANAALASTEGNPCPEIIIFDRHYVHLQGKGENEIRTFDPQSACFEGGEAEVRALRAYLRELQRSKVQE